MTAVPRPQAPSASGPGPGGGAVTLPLRSNPAAGVDQETQESLYAARVKLYPRAVTGRFASWRWGLVWATQLLFYGLPWIQWQGHQILLFDLEARKFYIGSFVLWPQDFFLLTLLLIASALGLFLFTAVAGRLWCGYACPQTVYTEMFLWIERKIQGDRYERMRLDRGPRTIERVFKKSATQTFWILTSFFTGLTFVGYFTPIRHLVPEIWNVQLGPWESFWIVFYGFATYGNAGYMREQVCKYMCPYARFQSAMFDRDTLIITYDSERGEPRGPRSRKADPKALGLGACVDCGVCVEVCPTGIDIRNGLQYECIGCAACIDGCNTIMDRMGYERGLIRYATSRQLEERSAASVLSHLFRPRVLVYTGVLCAIVAGILFGLVGRAPLKVDVIRDRGVLARWVDVDGQAGWVENVYRVQIMNQDRLAHRYHVSVAGLPGGEIEPSSEFVDGALVLPPTSSRTVVLEVRAHAGELAPGSHPIRLTIQAEDRPRDATTEKSAFLVPASP